jgi:uncharacterized metal-binding protein YceD (DUF177 family)
MGRLGAYKVDLKGLENDWSSYNWTVDQDFFSLVEGEDVQKGKVSVDLKVEKKSGIYHLSFNLNGTVIVTCDRCLDDMSLNIETTGALKVKLGADFADDGDMIIVPEDDGTVNVAWYIYEFITLAIPLKHVHAPGKCNKDMMEKLDEHLSTEEGESEVPEESGRTDSRWDELKNIIETNND